MKVDISRNIFKKYSFHENPSSGSRVVPRARTDGQTDMTNLIIAFRSFANVSENTGPSFKSESKWNSVNCRMVQEL